MIKKSGKGGNKDNKMESISADICPDPPKMSHMVIGIQLEHMYLSDNGYSGADKTCRKADYVKGCCHSDIIGLTAWRQDEASQGPGRAANFHISTKLLGKPYFGRCPNHRLDVRRARRFAFCLGISVT
jgi:hypothetical protein